MPNWGRKPEINTETSIESAKKVYHVGEKHERSEDVEDMNKHFTIYVILKEGYALLYPIIWHGNICRIESPRK